MATAAVAYGAADAAGGSGFLCVYIVALFIGNRPTPYRRAVSARLELKRQHAHEHEVSAVNTLEVTHDHRFAAQELRALRGPVARRTLAVFVATEHDERHALLLVAHRGVIDRHLLAGRMVIRDAAFGAGQHEVLDANVRERAAHHHFVIPAPRAVSVEVPCRR